jgi:hypothetical protein
MMEAEAAARAPRRSVGFQLAWPALHCDCGSGLCLYRQTGSTTVQPLPSSASVSNPDSPVAETTKTEDSSLIVRAKPDDPVTRPAELKPGPEPRNSRQCSGTAGPVRRATRRIFRNTRTRVAPGSWSSDQPEAVQNLQVIPSIRHRRDVMILGFHSQTGQTGRNNISNGLQQWLATAGYSSFKFRRCRQASNVQMRDSLVGDSNADCESKSQSSMNWGQIGKQDLINVQFSMLNPQSGCGKEGTLRNPFPD